MSNCYSNIKNDDNIKVAFLDFLEEEIGLDFEIDSCSEFITITVFDAEWQELKKIDEFLNSINGYYKEVEEEVVNPDMVDILGYMEDLEKVLHNETTSYHAKLLEVGQHNYKFFKILWWDEHRGYMTYLYEFDVRKLSCGVSYDNNYNLAKNRFEEI